MSKDSLIQALHQVTALPADTIAAAVVRPKSLSHGDWSFPCFPLSKLWGASPPECAKRLRNELRLPSSFDKVEAVGPYLNFFLERSSFSEQVISPILSTQDRVGSCPPNGRRLVLEYSSPNIAKTIHVGHLRTTLIGLSLDRIFRHLGFEVISVNHLGDWGTQFGFVFAGCTLWGRPSSPGVDELVDLYVRATSLRKMQDEGNVPEEDRHRPNVNEMAREYFRKLEAGDREATEFWRWCLDISVAYLKNIYARLGIRFDHYLGESFYKDMVPDVERLVKESGILEESRQALGVDLGKELGFVRVFTDDGRSLYITRDIAAAIYRHETYHPERNIYVVAAQQTLHFKQLVGILEKMGHPAAQEIVHVPFGFVPGMKTRDGGAISLENFLQEAYDRALTAYREEVEKKPEGLDEAAIAEKISVGATYFYFLSHSNIKDFNFSWKEALTFQGDSGPYVQYALARLHSIEAKARAAGISPLHSAFGIHLVDEDAHELVSLLSRFDETLHRAAGEYEPFILAAYLLEVARTFSKAYRSLRVVGEEPAIAGARLSLFIATRYVLHVGLTLIGVPPVERM